MSNLSITEYEIMSVDGGYPNAIPTSQTAVQNVSYTTVSTQSAAFNADTKYVRVVTDTASRILFGANPTALAASSIYLPAGRPEIFEVTAGEKVAAINA